jgi:hypothetical protein
MVTPNHPMHLTASKRVSARFVAPADRERSATNANGRHDIDDAD